MVAEHRRRRTKTAREMAEQLGVSERSIRKIVAEPRDAYEARAKDKQIRARQLRATGATYRQIADDLGISLGSVSTLLHRSPLSKAR